MNWDASIKVTLIYFTIGFIMGPIAWRSMHLKHNDFIRQMQFDMSNAREAGFWDAWLLGCFVQMCMVTCLALVWPIVTLGMLAGDTFEDEEDLDDDVG